jgi:hypothetical protein
MQRGLKHCLTTPTFRTFQALVGGFLAQPGLRTVTGMLVGARLSGVWHQATAHRFFSAARWSADQVGLVLLDRIVAWLPAAAPLVLIVDDSLFKRSGRKVFGTAWHYDAASACGTRSGAPTFCRSCWPESPAHPTATTWRWSPPIWTPRPPSSSSGTPPDGP